MFQWSLRQTERKIDKKLAKIITCTQEVAAESNLCVSDSEDDLFYPTPEVHLYNTLFSVVQNRLSTVLASVEAKDPLLGLDTILTK